MLYGKNGEIQRPEDKKFLVKMLDESSQIRDRDLPAPCSPDGNTGSDKHRSE